MILSRRSLLKQTGVIIPAITLLPKFAFPAPPLANAVEFLQGTSKKLGSVIVADMGSLNSKISPPISATRLFFSTAYQLQKSLPSDYPGKFSIIGTSDALGHNSFVVNMLPPSNFIPGSTTNPSLQILLASNSQYTNFVSMVFPNFTIADGDWHTFQISIGLLPTSPARWMITAVDINQEKFAINIPSLGFFTDPMGEAPLPSQTPPVAFNIPMISTGLAGSDKYALWLGQPITSRVGGYKPTGGGDNWLDSTPMKITQTYLNLTPTKNVNLGITATQFVNANGVLQPLLASISNANLSANTSEETINQYIRSPQTATLTAAASQLNTLKVNVTASVNQATKSGASSLTQLSLMAAQTYTAQAQAALAGQNPAGAVQDLNNVQSYLADAQTAAAEGQAAGGGIATSIPINPNTNTAIVSSAGSTPTVYMSGNNTTTTNVSTGSVVAGSSGSYYQNQVDGGVSLSNPNPSTYSNTVQPPDDSYMTIESIDITPE